MRLNQPVSQREHSYSSKQRIVSTTTPKGVITHVNQDFLDISGFTEDELLGQAHNIVRHPDMPQAAFSSMWDKIKGQQPWMGIVKNRCKNGDHYWVDAFVTPMKDNSGYQSVRLKPSADTVRRAEKSYRNINESRRWSLGGVFKQLTLLPSLLLTFSLPLVIALALWLLIGNLSTLPLILGLMLANSFAAILVSTPWIKAAKQSRSLINDPIARYIYTGRNDELGQLQLANKFLEAQKNTIIWRSSEAVEQLAQSSRSSNQTTDKTESNMQQLNKEVELVASAMTEMSATVQEVAQSAAHTASATQTACDSVSSGEKVVTSARNSIELLFESVGHSADITQQLAEDSKKISVIIDVINSITEQTNLLALNAAIEAARAGEAGRGFAVVADEVRTLAAKTQDSTGEISDMITGLQETAQRVYEAMQNSREQAHIGVAQTEKVNQSLDNILDHVTQINDMSFQIATAAEEQSQVSVEIDKSILNISDSATSTLHGCQQIRTSGKELSGSIDKLNNMIIQFQQ